MILRNFWITLRRFRLASGLNIVGLSVAFAAFTIILMQVRYDRSFDRFHRHADRIYHAEMVTSEGFIPVVSPGFAKHFGHLGAGIETYALVQPSYYDSYVTVERNGEAAGFLLSVSKAEAAFMQVFTPELIEGTPDVLSHSTRALVPASLAESLYGSRYGAVGRKLTVDGTDYTVGAVYRDFPDNSQIKNRIYLPLDLREDAVRWGNSDYKMYVLLHEGADPELVRQEWSRVDFGDKLGMELDLTAGLVRLADRYYEERPAAFGTDSLIERGKRTTTDLLLAIALLVICIAGVNFVNFATSLTPLRIKSINTRKVLGSSVGALRAELVVESVGIALLGFGLGLGWIYLLCDAGFDTLVSGGISFSTYSDVIWTGLAVALGVGIVAGIYPAIYTTSFPPALVLKGSFGLSPKGRKLRTALIGFQFVVSLGLIVAAMFLQLQNSYLRHRDIGMDYEGIVTLRLGGELTNSRAFDEQLRQSPLIEDVAYSQRKVGIGNVHTQMGAEYKGHVIMYGQEYVSWNFPQMMGIELAEGEYFTEGESRQPETNCYIFNEAARREYGMELGDQWLDRGIGRNARIVGFARNFNYSSMHSAVGPFALALSGTESGWNSSLLIAYVKIKGDPFEAVQYIRRAAATVDPAFPIDLQFFDAAFDALYRKELRITSLITLFSLLAVVLSLMGVFGLVVFETQYRRKEIGVRKVMGATVVEVLAMFNRKFVRLVLVCFVIATPLAWYGVREWLSTFAYRTPIYWWVFAASLAIVLFITLLTVTVQSWRAATANPVSALKAE